MRKKLKQLGQAERHTFEGVFKSVGIKHSYHGKSNPIYLPTLLFSPVSCDGEPMTNHLWCNYTKQFLALGQLVPGDRVRFDARVTSYVKGHYPNKITDYGIERPTKVQLIEDNSKLAREPMPMTKEDRNVLIGYIMNANQEFYLETGRPYEKYYVDQYKAWCLQLPDKVN